MRSDSARLLPGAELETEVLVVGAGPAGIVLALELARSGHRVILVESGSGTFNPEVQRLGDVTREDPWHVPASVATRRQFGGTSNLWAGRCVPMDPVDFEPRDLGSGARWPVSYEELQAYFARACTWCVCGEATFNAREIPTLAGRSLIPGWPEGDVRASSLERWSLPTNFGRYYREMIEASPSLTVMTDLTCTEIVCDSSGSQVSHVIARTLAGGHVRIRAARYALTCGGLGTVRLLLASNRLHRTGIGDHSGHLGRWYMTQIMVCLAQVHFATPPQETIYDFERDPDGVYVRRRFTFSPEFLLAHELPNAAMYLENPEIADASHGSAALSLIYLLLSSPIGGYLLAEGIRRNKLRTDSPVSRRAHWANILRNPAATARFALATGYRRYLRRGHREPGVFVPSAANVYPILYHGEHLPDRGSRVTLGSQRDALGMPRLRTRLRFGDGDIRGVLAAHGHLDRYLREHGLGYLRYLHDDPASTIREQLFGGYAQFGLTRMSARPEDGVLDENLAVHGFDDLFAASSSAFPTCGQANPTFMTVVMALRLADHLHRTLRQPVSSGQRGLQLGL
jgi:hypothetical protein